MHDELQIEGPIAYVIDDDAGLRDGVSNLLRSVDIAVEQFGSTKEFLNRQRPNVPGCLVLDVRLPGMSGLEFQAELGRLWNRYCNSIHHRPCRRADGREGHEGRCDRISLQAVSRTGSPRRSSKGDQQGL